MKYSLILLLALGACATYQKDASKQVGEINGKPVYQEESRSYTYYPSDSMPAISSAKMTEASVLRGYCGEGAGKVLSRDVTGEGTGYDPILTVAGTYYYTFKFVCE